MKQYYSIVVILLISFVFPSSLWAYTETFYLRKNGSGTAPETVAGAWNLRNVNDSRNWDTDDDNDGKLGPNDRLIVLDDDGIIFGKLSIRQSGLLGKPIVIEGEGSACIDGKGGGDKTIEINNKSYIIIQDLEIRNTAKASLGGIWIHNDSDNNTIRRCEIHHCGESGIDIGYDRIRTHNCDNNIVEYCNIHHNGSYTIYGPSGISFWKSGSNNIARYNYLHHNSRGSSRGDGNGIIFDQVTTGKNYAYYNICTHNDGSGINVTASTTIYLYGNVCYQNSLAWNHYGGILITPSGTQTKPSVVMKNNILYNNNNYDLTVDSTSGHTIDYNHYGPGIVILMEGWRKWTFNQLQNNTSYEDHGISGDPKFLHYIPTSWGDFRLKFDSPCIDAGANLETLYDNALDPEDLTWPPSLASQNSNGSGWEIGAFVLKKR